MKAFAAVLIAFVLFFESCFIPPLYKNDEDEQAIQSDTETVGTNTYFEDDYVIPDGVGRERYELLDESEKVCYSMINDACNVMNEQAFPVPNELDMDKMHEAFDAYVSDYPETFWLYRSFSRLEQGDRVYMRLTYTVDGDKKEEMCAKLDEIVKKQVDSAKLSDDSFERELALHDFITSVCEYDYAAADNGYENYELSYTAYGALVNGKAVCEGYARAMQLLCTKCGIECTLVSGCAGEERISHMWNIVTVGGEKYHLDVTWDDNDDFGTKRKDGDGKGSESDSEHDSDNFIDLTNQESEQIADSDPDGSQYLYFNLPDKMICYDHFDFECDECISTAANYYERNGLFLYGWNDESADTLTRSIKEKQRVGEGYVTVAFLNEEDYNIAMEYLVEESGIFDIIKKANKGPDMKLSTESLDYKTRYGPLILLTLELNYK